MNVKIWKNNNLNKWNNHDYLTTEKIFSMFSLTKGNSLCHKLKFLISISLEPDGVSFDILEIGYLIKQNSLIEIRYKVVKI